jgi:hypothetical protein
MPTNVQYPGPYEYEGDPALKELDHKLWREHNIEIWDHAPLRTFFNAMPPFTTPRGGLNYRQPPTDFVPYKRPTRRERLAEAKKKRRQARWAKLRLTRNWKWRRWPWVMPKPYVDPDDVDWDDDE